MMEQVQARKRQEIQIQRVVLSHDMTKEKLKKNLEKKYCESRCTYSYC